MSEARTEASAQSSDLKTRTKSLALRVLHVYAALPNSVPAQVIGKQLVRSATSVGAHYREATFARSHPEFISKIEVALQELEESRFWMELLVEGGFLGEHRLADLLSEAGELVAILVTCVKNTKSRRTKPTASLTPDHPSA